MPQVAAKRGSKHIKKSQNKWPIRPIAFFVLFLLGAVPLEYHAKWVFQLRLGLPFPDSILLPLTSGILFFCTLTICTESLLIIATQFGLRALDDNKVALLEAANGIIMFICFIVMITNPTNLTQLDANRQFIEGPIIIKDHTFMTIQWLCCVFSLIVSGLVHTLVIRYQEHAA